MQQLGTQCTQCNGEPDGQLVLVPTWISGDTGVLRYNDSLPIHPNKRIKYASDQQTTSIEQMETVQQLAATIEELKKAVAELEKKLIEKGDVTTNQT